MRFINAYQTPYSQDYYDSLINASETTKKQISENLLTSIADSNSKMNKWINLINSISPDLINDSACTLQVWMKDDKKISFNAYFALSNLDLWATNYINNPEQWKLTQKEEKLVVEDLIDKTQNYDLSKLFIYKKEAEIKLILDIYMSHCTNIRKDFLSINRNPQMNEENWIEKLFNSRAIKNLLEQADVKDLKNFFDEESLKILIKRANLKINIKSFPDMLCNLMPIASPLSWIQSYSGKNSFNINSFFDNIVIRSYAYSLTKGILSSKTRYSYTSSQEAFKNQIEYLSPVLNSRYINQNDLIKFWDSIFSISKERENPDLFKMICRNVELPTRDETLGSETFYKKYDTAHIENNTNIGDKIVFIKDLYLLVKQEKLSEMLIEKTEQTHQFKKVKI